MKLYSCSALVGAFLQAENGRIVKVMRIAHTKYHFRHCETSRDMGKFLSSNFIKGALTTTTGTKVSFLFSNFKHGFAFLSNSNWHKVFVEENLFF